MRNYKKQTAIALTTMMVLSNISSINVEANEVKGDLNVLSGKQYEKKDGYELVNPNYYVGYLYDSNYNSQRLGYLGIEDANLNDFNLGFLIQYRAYNELDMYYTAEIYKNINDSLVHSDSLNFNFTRNERISIGNLSMSSNLNKKKYNDQKYLYIKFGVSKDKYSGYSDYLTFKVLNPFYNEKPEIKAYDKEIKTGDKFDALDGVIAFDKEDGDITNKIEIIENTVNADEAGEYKVVYKVTDSQGASTIKGIKVIVKQGLIPINYAPKLSVNDIEIKTGDIFNPLEFVVANDKEDGDITDKIEVVENTVNTNKAGEYKVVYKVTDSQGASTTTTAKVIVKQAIINLNSVPQINAKNIEIKLGEKFNPLKYATAIDKEDGDLTNKIEVIENTVNTGKEGIYKVTYKVTDSNGASTTKTINISVVIGLIGIDEVPNIYANNVEIKTGDKFDPLKGVTAFDKEDGNITNKIEVIENTVNVNVAGEYKVVYKVTDNNGASTTKTIKVKVNQKLITINSIPSISVKDISLKIGDKFDPLYGVSALDKEDGDITNKIEILENTVNTSKEGIYKVIYKVTDSQGAVAISKIKVNVKKPAIILNNVPQIDAEDINIELGEIFDPLKNVIANDKEDGNITNKIEILENTVDINKVGEYKVVYKVTDSQGASVTKSIRVYVKLKSIEINNIPEINAKDISIKLGEKFNPLNGVTAIDKEDGDITSKIKIIENTVDENKEGTYKVVYKIVDGDGAIRIKEIKVTVRKTAINKEDVENDTTIKEEKLPATGYSGVGYLGVVMATIGGSLLGLRRKNK